MKTRERRFWNVMNYQCDKCRFRVPFYLEDGCEGPRDGGSSLVTIPGHTGEWPQTASGRFVVPVPLVAGGCPKCQRRRPWGLSAGVLQHVAWGSDQTLDPPVLESDVPAYAGRFHYPQGDVSKRDEHGQLPCGHPELAAWENSTAQPREVVE